MVSARGHPAETARSEFWTSLGPGNAQFVYIYMEFTFSGVFAYAKLRVVRRKLQFATQIKKFKIGFPLKKRHRCFIDSVTCRDVCSIDSGVICVCIYFRLAIHQVLVRRMRFTRNLRACLDVCKVVFCIYGRRKSLVW
jgi:hypothetical protein